MTKPTLTIKCDKLLPDQLCIDRSENHLYRIGLCLSTDRPTHRNDFHHPWLLFAVNTTYLIKVLYCLALEDTAEELLYLGDFSHLIGIRMHFNLACFFYTGFGIALQLTHLYNYRHDIHPNYMSVFDMMSGIITPKSIGLTNEKEVLGITRTTRKIFRLAHIGIPASVPLFQFTLSFTLFYLLCPTKFIFFGILGSIHYSWASYYVYNIHVFSVIYFYIICRYIKIKINTENLKINVLQPSKIGFSKSMAHSIRTLASIHKEIADFNDNYWSRYLLFVWFLYGIVIVLCIFMLFFSPMHPYIKIGYSYLTAIIVLTFVFIMINAASVNLIALKSYRYLNNIIAADFADRLFYNTSKVMASLKASTFIEGLGKGEVGFWCWKLFIIDYFGFYEVIMFSAGLFLKLVQMSENNQLL